MWSNNKHNIFFNQSNVDHNKKNKPDFHAGQGRALEADDNLIKYDFIALVRDLYF